MNHGNVSKEIAGGLIHLKDRIAAAKIPSSKIDETLNIATWNIREFGKSKRSDASIHYIAEIIGQFDLVGIVELRDNLSDLGRALQILGPYWKAVYSDMIPDAGGNKERLAFIYDKRAVVFNGLAAEPNPPRKKKGTEYVNDINFWRNPYMASFKSGSFDFVILSAHIRWGSSETDRVKELTMLADWIEVKRKDETAEDKDMIVMGDFNIPKNSGTLFDAITSHGLQIPKALSGLKIGSNLEKDKRYDQILHYASFPENFTNAGGVLDFHIDDNHIKELYPKGISKSAYTFQMSDHLPLWIQINTDIETFKLQQIIQG
jgi:endonuclease/exonuclease/phosphatase family metal-dependent hydrolase